MIDEEILTIEEVAKFLKVSERTVYDWAQKGEIPSGKIGTAWRFKKSDIVNWIDDKLSEKRFIPQAGRIQLETVISPDRIVFLNHSSKQDVLLAMAENISTAPQIKNSRELAREILKREELMSTAIGRGIAIPHVRLSSVTDLVVSVGVNQGGVIGFKALDDEPVRLLFMIAAAYNQHAYYLQTLSFFSARLKNNELRRSILAAQTPLAVYDLLTGQW
jgi:PTS system nitrogen regulatory IIA component